MFILVNTSYELYQLQVTTFSVRLFDMTYDLKEKLKHLISKAVQLNKPLLTGCSIKHELFPPKTFRSELIATNTMSLSIR